MHVRIDRRRKLPVTTLLYALGLDQEKILDYFYAKIAFKRTKDGAWTTTLDPAWMRNAKVTSDWKNAKTGEVIAEASHKLTARTLPQMAGEEGIKTVSIAEDEIIGRFSALDMVNVETGEIYVEAGDEFTAANLAQLHEQGFNEVEVINVDNISLGAYVAQHHGGGQESQPRTGIDRHLPRHASG